MMRPEKLRSCDANAWMDDPGKVDIVRQMKEDFDWAMCNQTWLEQMYPAQSVVVWRKQVVGQCHTAPHAGAIVLP